MENHIPLYVLNSFLKFEKKLYQVFGLPLGRPIRMKSILYAVVIGLIELVIYYTPIIGKLIRWMPLIFLIMIPIGVAWLLSDIGTEDRSPASFFKSFILYHFRKVKGDSYYRNRMVKKERTYNFNNYITYQKTTTPITKDELLAIKNAENEQLRTIRYLERITNPDDFFRKLKEDELNKRRNRRWFFFKKGA